MALINLRNALMGGKRLPYDAEVEFLESTGTQWIDTGIISDGTGLTVEVTCSKTTSATQEMAIVGRSRSDGFDLYVLNSKFELWNSNGRVAKNPTTISAGEVYDVIGSTTGSAVNLSVNGVNSSHSSIASFPNGNIVLFRHNSRYYWVGRLMFCKIWDNGVLVRDYIPVRVGSTGYLYDRVSGRLFGNAGTGDFVLGPDVVPVEYIESHGTEYIDTGVVPTSLTKWDIDAQFTSSDYGQIMGRGGTPSLNPRFAFGLDIQSSGHGLTWYCGMGNVNTWNGTFNTFRHTFSLDAPYKTFTIDTTSYSVPFSSIGDTTIMQLFARFVNGSVRNFCKAKIFKSSIIDNGLPVRSFRPVRVGTEGAMMDTLTRRIYRNAGTGAFTYGNDLKYPIPAE